MIVVASVSCIYGLGSPDDYRAMMVGLRRGQTDRPRRTAAASWSTCSTSGTTSISRAASFACAAIASSSGRRTKSSPIGSSSGATRSSSCRSSIRPAARSIEQQEELFIYPAKHFVLPEERIAAAVVDDQAGAGRAARAIRRTGQAARSPAAQCPHAVRHRDDAGGRLLPGHRELQPAA